MTTTTRKQKKNVFNKIQQYSTILPGEERIHQSPLVDVPITGTPDGNVKTLYDLIQRAAQMNPEGNFLGDLNEAGQFEWDNYKQSVETAHQLASGLHQLGARPGQLLAIAGIHSRRYMHAIHGMMSNSMPIVPLYHNSKLQVLCEIIANCRIEYLFCDNKKRADEFVQERSNGEIPTLKTIIILNEHVEEETNNGVRFISYDRLLTLGKENLQELEKPKPESIYVICHTSGTTGKPKGVEMSHGGILAAVGGIYTTWCLSNKWEFTNTDIYFSFLSLAHIYEHLMQSLTIYVAGSIGIYSGNVSTLIPEIQLLKPTILSLVPRLLNKFYDQVHQSMSKKNALTQKLFAFAKKQKIKKLEAGKVKFNTVWDKLIFKKIHTMLGGQLRVVTTGGAPLTKDVKQFSRIAYGCPLIEGYGQTECSAAGTVTMPSDTSYGNVGGPAPWAQIKLIDVPELNYFSAKDEGEVCFRGAALMTSYFDDEKLTNETIDSDGWLHTGDIGRWLPDGRLQIFDRKNEIFKLAQGDFVLPEQIETVYLQSNLISQMFVTGSTERSCLVAIGVVHLQQLKKFLDQKKPNLRDLDTSQLLENEQVRKVVLDEINAIGKDGGLQTIELIKNIALTSEEFTAENGLVTSTLKNRRKLLRSHFKDTIDRLYAEIDEL